MATTYDVGDLVRLSAAYTDGTGAAVDPTVVKLSYHFYGGATVTLVYLTDLALIRDSAGHYHADVSVTGAGRMDYRWWSTGTGQASEEGAVSVREQAVVVP